VFDVRIPSLGESVTEAQIARWAKNDGDTVGPDDVLLELESDKATMELPAERAGVLRILKQTGETVVEGDVVARIEENARAAAPARAPVAAPARAPSPPVAAAPAASDSRPATAPVAGRPVGPLSPAVRNLIDEHGLDPSAIPASGKGGRLTKGDILTHLERRDTLAKVRAATSPAPAGVAASSASPTIARPAPRPAGDGGDERVPMSRIRKRIAERLVAAQHTAAILTTFNEIDCSAIMALRAQHKDRFKEKYGIGLGFMSFFARACIAALQEVPAVNAEIDGDDVVYHRFVHLGVAVGTERGLVVPVVRNADRMSFADLEREIGRLAGLARDGKLAVDDLQGGTFTISNGGVYGSLLSTPILNPPQSGILGMHKIEKRPVVVNDQIVIRPMMYVALSYDHRLVDGEQAVTFLVRVKERLEDPARLLLEV
jgi:2-oxoglutarate dehydrogenase E2 component (dihydrolipoamide succinyltransferase)